MFTAQRNIVSLQCPTNQENLTQWCKPRFYLAPELVRCGRYMKYEGSLSSYPIKILLFPNNHIYMDLISILSKNFLIKMCRFYSKNLIKISRTAFLLTFRYNIQFSNTKAHILMKRYLLNAILQNRFFLHPMKINIFV